MIAFFKLLKHRDRYGSLGVFFELSSAKNITNTNRPVSEKKITRPKNGDFEKIASIRHKEC